MPDPIQGTEFELYVLDVSVSPTLYVLVDGINNWDDSVTRERTKHPMFGRATDFQTIGSREITYAMQGNLIIADPGQEIIRAAELADDEVSIKVLYDGTNGYTQDVIVGTRQGSRAAGTGLQTLNYEIAAVGDAVVVGSGPVP